MPCFDFPEGKLPHASEHGRRKLSCEPHHDNSSPNTLVVGPFKYDFVSIFTQDREGQSDGRAKKSSDRRLMRDKDRPRCVLRTPTKFHARLCCPNGYSCMPYSVQVAKGHIVNKSPAPQPSVEILVIASFAPPILSHRY